MPKGKAKAKNPDLYTQEDEEARQRRRMAPQAVPHRRGGTHRVKDEDRTYTHWDDRNHQELLGAVKDAGLYIKDMSKAAMTKALAKKDREDMIETNRAQREEAKKKKDFEEKAKREQEEKAEKERAKKEAEQRRREKEKRIAEGESDVSSLTYSDEESNEYERMWNENVGVGHILSDSDEDSYESSTTATTSRATVTGPIPPAEKLRLYEWPYGGMPPLDSPRSPVSPTGRIREEVLPEQYPRKLPYGVMNVVTTNTNEMLELPGRQYAEEVSPDFVPALSEHTKDCARNGILHGHLHSAIIERGADWEERTHVQWWNGRLYFYLSPKKSKAALADVYQKWKYRKDNKPRAKRVNGITKLDPKRKAQQMQQEKREKMLDVFMASEYRPPICYVPSFLEYPLMDDDEEVIKSEDSLFYIRFPGMDLPHYYFWADPMEWDNPTVPNPEWVETDGQDATQINGQKAAQHLQDVELASIASSSPSPAKTMIKRIPMPRKFDPSKNLPKTSKYKTAVWAIERDMYNNGWANTMYVLREKWISEGKIAEWRHLISRLPVMFPSGNLPNSPPVNTRANELSIAEKLADIEVPSEKRPIEPIKGNEPWTRDDAAYWTAVDVQRDLTESDIQDALLRDIHSPTSPLSLNRRPSEVVAWMDELRSPSSPNAVPPTPPESQHSPSGKRAAERRVWEDLFLHNVEAETALASQIEQMPVADLKHNLYVVMSGRKRQSWPSDRCYLCLQRFDPNDHEAVISHYALHQDQSNDTCPFCNMPWAAFSSATKAAHIFHHDVNEGAGKRRCSSTSPSGTNALFAVPRTRRSSNRLIKQVAVESLIRIEPRRPSKVSFSPNTVERRVAYNDHSEDNGMDADVSSISTISPRRSSLRKRPTKTLRSRKPALTIATSMRSERVTSSRKSDNARTLIRNSKRKRKTRERRLIEVPLETYAELSSTSTQSMSPDLPPHRRTRQHPADDPNEAWKPKQQTSSDSEHVPSPALPTVKRYPPKHSDAAYDPRKASKSSLESLEYHTGRRKPRKINLAKENTLERRPSNPAITSKHSRPRSKAKADDSAYENVSSSADSNLYEPVRISKKRGKGKDSTYRDVPPSPPSSGSRSPTFTKRKRPTDPTYCKQLELSSSSNTDERPAKREKAATARLRIGKSPRVLQNSPAKGQKADVYVSTVTKVSAGSDNKKFSPLARLDIDVFSMPNILANTAFRSNLGTRAHQHIAPPASNDPSAPLNAFNTEDTFVQRVKTVAKRRSLPAAISPRASGADPQGSRKSKKRKVLDASKAALNRRIAAESSADFIAIPEQSLSEDHETDILTGNPFVAPQRTPQVVKEKKKTEAKVSTVKGVALATKRVAAQKQSRNSTTTTVLGRPIVEPLILAPARRLPPSSKAKTCLTPSSIDVQAILSPSKRTSRSFVSSALEGNAVPKKQHSNETRHYRSPATTPSPSLTNVTCRTSIAPRSTGSARLSTGKTSPVPIDIAMTKRKASYDVPFSDVRPIVPPNTPANRLLKKLKKSTIEEVAHVHSDQLGGSLDVGLLKNKIGKVKTAQQGRVEKLLIAADQRGRSNTKAKRGSQEHESTRMAEKVKRETGNGLGKNTITLSLLAKRRKIEGNTDKEVKQAPEARKMKIALRATHHEKGSRASEAKPTAKVIKGEATVERRVSRRLAAKAEKDAKCMREMHEEAHENLASQR